MFGYGSVIIKENLYKEVFAFFCQYIALSQASFRQKKTHFALTTLVIKKWKFVNDFRRIKGPLRKDHFTWPSVYRLLLEEISRLPLDVFS
jgi:hypothetical protein